MFKRLNNLKGKFYILIRNNATSAPTLIRDVSRQEKSSKPRNYRLIVDWDYNAPRVWTTMRDEFIPFPRYDEN